MTKKILLVEDELFVRELYERVLSQAGFKVVTAIDGAAGLNSAQDRPDLILLDIMLPKIDGITVLRKLKQDKTIKGIPVILLTNLGQESVVEEAFKIGAQDYLLKIKLAPYELVETVEGFFG